MQKQTTPAGHKATKQNRKPSAAVVLQATPSGAMAAVAAVLAKQPAPAPVAAPAPAPAPVAAPTPTTNLVATMHALLAPKQPQAAPAAAAPTVAIRGGLAIAAVRLTGKRYNVTAGHNVGWWQQCQQAAGGGTASVAALVQAGVPAIFVGYVVRRGYMVAA